MIARLEFKLPEEQEEYKTANNAQALQSILWHLDQDLRSKLHHGHSYKTADEALEDIRQRLHTEMIEEGIKLH